MRSSVAPLSIVTRESADADPEGRAPGMVRGKDQIFSLTGLRFCAAALVLIGHTVGQSFQPGHVPILKEFWHTGVAGMTLFLTLSGFMIHYNYGHTLIGLRLDAVWKFAVARFACLYPLFPLVVLISIAFAGTVPPVVPYIWPHYLTMTHGWFYLQFVGVDLGDALAPGSWSISVEIFCISSMSLRSSRHAHGSKQPGRY
jgi:peptidoglycan/LPS O-acetylase OafA/YrhL